MPSQLRSETARINGAKSQGPITPEGKLASARSNLKHGLRSAAVVLDGECVEGFDELHESVFTLLRPVGPLEIGLAENMVMCRWRQLRIWAMEKSALNHEIRKQALANSGEDKPTCAALAHRALSDESSSFDNFSRHETRFDRQFSRALTRFRELRANPSLQVPFEVKEGLTETPPEKI